MIDGLEVARQVRHEVATGVSASLADSGTPPGLATVLIGDDPGYVRNKRKACAAAGTIDRHRHLAGDVDQATVGSLIDELAADDAVSGILLQLPTPAHLDSQALLAKIPADKDIDGLTVANAGPWDGRSLSAGSAGSWGRPAVGCSRPSRLAVHNGTLGTRWSFYTFAIPAVLTAGAVLLVPRSMASRKRKEGTDAIRP
jgi:hypothetical protein